MSRSLCRLPCSPKRSQFDRRLGTFIYSFNTSLTPPVVICNYRLLHTCLGPSDFVQTTSGTFPRRLLPARGCPLNSKICRKILTSLFAVIDPLKLLILYPPPYFTQSLVHSWTTAKIMSQRQMITSWLWSCQTEHGIDLTASMINGTAYTTDGDMQHKGFRFAIAEIKNEIGSSRYEPHMQALLYYIHSTKTFAKDDPAFRFPCILISLFGPHIDFSAAVWDTRPNMQVISTALPLFYHRTDTKMREMVARHVGALRKALHSLLKCYANMASSTTSPSTDPNPCFPYPSSYTCIKTASTCRFTYQAQMDTQRLLFSAKTEDDESKMLCIKFVRHYSQEAHQRCASGGFAPALYGFENLPGGWYMIVMEMIPEDYCCLGELSDPYLHHDALATGLLSLHQEGYVHGDIRDTNVMVKRDRSPGFKLVDFDWSGKIGEIRYPMNVYRGGRLWRPDGADDGQLILAEHDIQMLHAIFPPGTFEIALHTAASRGQSWVTGTGHMFGTN
ncbi:hypothetical protein DEU56DRAFT_565712 [Suillus clintonianus]|uniref:uncharacterized protein n=1 Tax=Suillus clintonianus TaxID=1904413 RepID=UPI001B882AFC|nr:uncharacterized protein DEU56DRAFT_565712 [Suillus clintonianus]KAG2125667.1 hypothetical protein DEU56DRAFT_565712 [Suillus clintonianus]